jgi:hypothetical protein
MFLRRISIVLFYAVMCMSWIIAVDSRKTETEVDIFSTHTAIEAPLCKFDDFKATQIKTENNVTRV